MKQLSQKLLEKAARSIRTAKNLVSANDTDFASNRVYYAMFYTTEALLNEEDLRFKKHAGVHSAFGEHFVKSGLFDQKFHRWLIEAFNKRITSDYGVDAEFFKDEILKMINQAAMTFIEIIHTFFQQGSHDSPSAFIKSKFSFQSGAGAEEFLSLARKFLEKSKAS